MQKQISDSRYCTSVAELNVQMDWCDKYEFGLAAFCGAMAGFIDVFFVQMPGRKSALNQLTDHQVDTLVKKFAKFSGWNPKDGNENSIASAIGFLERTYTVSYTHLTLPTIA